MFWKKKNKPTMALWLNNEARCRGVLQNVQDSIAKKHLTFLVTHFESTADQLAQDTHQLDLTAGRIESIEEIGDSSLEAIRSNQVVGLLPFSVLERGAPFQAAAQKSQENATIIVPEVHPINSPDELITSWARSLPYAAKCQFHCSLDSAFFKNSQDGERLLQLLERLGMSADEPLESGSFLGSIQRLQKRYAKSVQSNQPAKSQEEWMSLNLPSK